ncbi:HNH endonuclease [Mesorhizobium sp. LjRoot246]|uniref:HNH endonuclease n=1 Tax=Mesorhizobium sp. LjRoot246 TaxID=3342294 RepID=UPI003ECD4672
MVSIIPLSIAQRRLDTGNAPQYPQGSPVGGAMQGLGDQFSAIAERYQQMKDQQEAFDAELARRRFTSRIAQAEDEVAANAPADGAGLHEAMYGQVDPRDGRVVKTGLFDTLFDAALPSMPQSQHANFASQKETLRAVGARRMAQRQLQCRKDYEQAQVDTALKTSAIAIGKADPDDPVTFEAARQEGLDLIDKMGLDPGIRQQKVKDWFGTAAKARFEALIAKDPKRALEMFGVGTPASGSDASGDVAQTAGSSFSGSPNMAGGKDGRVGTQTPDERIAQAFRDDLPQQEQEALALKAKVTKFTQDIETRVAIYRAEAEAADETSRTGAYSGGMPGRDAYRTIYGLDEGDKRWKVLEWQTNVGKRIFDMGTMSNLAIHAALRDADAGPNTSQEDQALHNATTVAAKLVLERRRADLGGYVSELSPNISAGWKAVFGTGPSDPEAFDQDNYDKTLALSVASQKALGIDDENLQPVPFSILRKLAEDRDSGSMYFMDNYAKASALFAGTKGPVARAALVRELDDAGLGGILPGGKPRLSVGEVLRADAKALGKTAANAGIALANANEWVAYGMSGATITPPDYKDAYYEPSDNVEKVMMRQGSDALGWAIPWPGAGRAAVAEEGIARAIESIGSGAAERAERLIADKLGSEAVAKDAGTGAIRAPAGQFYSVIHEMRLDPSLYPGSSRPVHVQAANESLLQTMEGEIAFAQDLLNQGLNLQRTPTGLAPRAAPLGFSWHHADEPGVMQLVPRSQHDGGSNFQKTLHPNGRGGFSLWGKK